MKTQRFKDQFEKDENSKSYASYTEYLEDQLMNERVGREIISNNYKDKMKRIIEIVTGVKELPTLIHPILWTEEDGTWTATCNEMIIGEVSTTDDVVSQYESQIKMRVARPRPFYWAILLLTDNHSGFCDSIEHGKAEVEKAFHDFINTVIKTK